MKTALQALIKKDLQAVTANKRLFTSILVVPLVMAVILPTMFLCMIHFMPEESGDLQELLALLPFTVTAENMEKVLSGLVLNYIMPVFFLLIPVMASSITAASSFVGEKEKHTLETLLYCPLTLREIFRAKVLASFLLSMFVTLASVLCMFAAVETELWFFSGALVAPEIKWLVLLLVVTPGVSLIAITLIVRSSAKSQTVEEAQQGAVFLLLPIMALLIGQFAGVLLISAWLLLGIGAVCLLAGWLLLHRAMGRFTYEMLLR